LKIRKISNFVCFV